LSSERLKQYNRTECSEIGCLGHDFFGMAARAGELRSPGHAGAAMPQAVRDQLSAGSPRGSDRGNRKLFGKIWHHGNTETRRHRENLKTGSAKARASCVSCRNFELTELGEPTEHRTGRARFGGGRNSAAAAILGLRPCGATSPLFPTSIDFVS
jgi:hypothetical protein